MKIENYSVYTNEPYASNFRKLYKGVIIVVDTDNLGINPYMHFAVRKKKVKETIFKTRLECMHKLIFNDVEKSLTCEFERVEKNKCPSTLVFDDDTYNEILEQLPKYFKEQSLNENEYTITAIKNGLEIIINNIKKQ